jgi:hypothetical protein
MAGHERGSRGRGAGADFDPCPFGSAPAAAPIVQFVAAAAPIDRVLEPAAALEPVPVAVRILRSPRARGPPIPA